MSLMWEIGNVLDQELVENILGALFHFSVAAKKKGKARTEKYNVQKIILKLLFRKAESYFSSSYRTLLK